MNFDFLDEGLSELFEEFLQGLSKNTQDHYILAVRGICLAKGSFLHLYPDDIYDYFHGLELAESTKSTIYYCLRSFSVFLLSHIDGYSSPFLFLGLGSKAPDYLMEDFPESKLPDLFRSLGDDSDAALAVRFAMYMCLSISEISNLRPDMFYFNDQSGILSIQRVAATNQSDGIYRLRIPDVLIEPIRKRMDREYIILSDYGKHLSIRGIQRRLAAANTSWTFQRLRSYGMLLKLREGYSEFEVAEYAGVDGRWLYRYRKLIATENNLS